VFSGTAREHPGHRLAAVRCSRPRTN